MRFVPLQAIDEFNMIVEGDRVLVCLSGGKDSLSLLHTLHQYQYLARGKVLPHTHTHTRTLLITASLVAGC